MTATTRARRCLAILAAACALTLIACSGSKGATPTPGITPAAAQFATARCPVGAPEGQTMECGYLVVPENRAKAGSNMIKLAVAVIRSTSPSPDPDPMLYLSGGPGQPGLADNMQSFSKTFAEPVQSKRDLVFLDQRGTGNSVPALDCPEVGVAFKAALAQDIRNDAQNEGQDAALRACRDRLAKDNNIDFAGYNSEENARDIKDLMQALGYARYNIYGLSYGTRLALEVMRQDPEHV